MGVLVMLELDGDPDALMAASDRLDELLGVPAGMLVRMVARTDEGIVLWQLWESEAARVANAENAAHQEALAASGIRDVATSMRSRAFPETALRHPAT